MKGTTSILRLLLGREPSVDREGEQLFEGAHIFDCFALVNYLLCSAVREPRVGFGENFTGGARGHSSRVMRANCAGHFFRTLEILEPTVIVAQGQGVRRWMALALTIPKPDQLVERIEVGQHEVDLPTFNHPSAGGRSAYWGASHKSRYLQEVVAPTIRCYLASRQNPL